MSTFKVTSIIMEDSEIHNKNEIMEIEREILESIYDAVDYSDDEDDTTEIVNNFIDYNRSQGVYIYDMDIEFVWDD